MKHCLVALSALLAAASAYSQGTINFSNKTTGVDARVSYSSANTFAVGGGTTPDTQFVAQLYVIGGAPVGPTGPVIPFRNTPAAGNGYWPGQSVTVATPAPGGPVDVKVLVWSTGLGATYEAAKATGLGGVLESAPLKLAATGGAGVPPSTAANLVGLTFNGSIATIVPEPTVAALGLVGAGLLLFRRKK